MPAEPHSVPRVVVIGAGFAGLTAGSHLAKLPVDLTIVDRRNHHLFQPLLYQVATAGLSPADIASPIRSLFRGRHNTSVLLGLVTDIDTVSRSVIVDDRHLPYDILVVATGARHAYFGHDDWEAVAPGLKQIEDATAIRRRILIALECAEAAEDPAERNRLLTFAVIGAGPTGVELAGALAELAKVALAMDFRRIDPRDARIILIEAGERVLPSFHPSLSTRAEASLLALGVDVRHGTPVTACTPQGVMIGNQFVPTATILWAAGVMASPAAAWLNAAHDRAGRIIVEPDLTLPGQKDVFVIGDTASVRGPDGAPLPGLAPVAKQQGAYVAKAITRRLAGRDVEPFRYRHLGSLATIGRGRAVADFGWLRLSGRLAWLLWGLVHIAFLIGFRNRLVVLLDWLWAYVTFRRGARLITGAPMN
jgi:NADH:ubiquinone reductase (H+-translocating)